MTAHRKRPNNKPKPGEKVILIALPAGFLGDLPEEDQQDISAVLGKPVVLSKYEKDGRVELEFTDKDGHYHSIWVDPKFIKPT